MKAIYPRSMTALLFTQAAVTLMMVGIIWFVQTVHYPLYSHINPDAFPNYEVAHVNRVSILVGPLMFIEAGTAAMLLLTPHTRIPLWSVLLGLGLVALLWMITVFANVPQHNALSFAFDAKIHRQLLMANWARTLLWTARGALVLWMLYRVIDA